MRLESIKFLIFPLFIACTGSSPTENKSTTPEPNPPQTEENSAGQERLLEETVPDTGLMNNVNPEEIITDDWSDEGEVDLNTEK